MWGNPHDEYAGGNPNKANKETVKGNAKGNAKGSRQRGISKNKRPQRPTFESEEPNPNNSDNNINNATSDPQSNHKYRGRGTGRTNRENKKSNPWVHAHDEYAVPKPRKNEAAQKARSKSPKQKSRRPVRIRFETAPEEDKNNMNFDAEEKSNRPLNNISNVNNNRNRKRKKRPQKKKPSYVNAANMHSRSGYRAKPLPPDPSANRKTNLQRIAHGQANFEAMIKQAAAMEGLDKSDIRVQRMIQRLGDQMSEVTGFNRFLQNKDDELARVVSKQDKRRKQMDRVTRNINNRSGKHHPNPSTGSDPQHLTRKGSVKDMAARFEQRSRTQGRRQRNKTKTSTAHRNALKLPNTKSHRRRVSSQFSIQTLNAVINSSKPSSMHAHSPFTDNIDSNNQLGSFPNTLQVNMMNGMDDNASDISAHDTHTLVISGGRGRTASHGSRASFSRGSRVSAVPSVIMMKGPANSDQTITIIQTPLGDDMDDNKSHVTPSVDGTYAGDPLNLLITILKCEPQERSEDQIDYLVGFFENYQIMTEDVDTWSGKATFRSFIQQTRYRHVPINKHIFREGDDGDVFYFVLRGNVSVMVDDSNIVHTNSSKRNLGAYTHKKEIHVVEDHHVFGEIAMFNQGKRSATCVAKTDTHLAFWDRATYDEFIRPMKELKSKAQKILRDKQGNMLSEDQLIEKAAMFLDDAMHGRELKMHRNGPWPRRIHKLINHKYFNYCLVMVSMLWLSLIFIEPPSYRDSIIDDKSSYFYRIMPLIAFEWFVFIIFAGECLLRFYSFGSSWFFTIDLHVMRVILLLIVFIDLIITCIYNGNSFRFSRVIRPIFPVLFIRDLRRQYYIVLACVPYIIELLILWGIIAAIFARIAYHIFYHSEGNLIDGRHSVYMADRFAMGEYPYNEKMYDYCQAALNPDNNLKSCDQFFDSFVWNSFDTFFKSLIALFALLTTENFPEVWWPTWLSNEGKPYWTFFLVYALIAVFFLLNLFSAAVYDAYIHIISQLDVVDEKRETQALKVAWICLDTSDSGCIGPQKFENLMYRLKPEYTEFEIGVIFKLLDPDNNHLIDAEDFSVMMINLLYLSISRKATSKEDELKLYLQKLGAKCPYGYEILRAFTSQTWRYIMLMVQVVDICALLCYHQEPDAFNYVDFICILMILFALIIDVIFKHRSQISTYFKSNKNRLYFGLTIIQTIGTFTGIIKDREWISALRFFGILRMLIVGVFALEKIKYLRTSLTRTLTQTVILMIPVFLRIVVYTSVVLLYMYTIIGIEVFVDPNSETWGKSRCDAPQQLLSNPYALFCDAQMTIITLTQILTTNNWHIIMYKAIEVTDNWFNALYFISFFFFGPILVVSLLLAMFFNMFFGISVQSENELASFFHETDAEAQNLQAHMELQEIRDHMDDEMYDSINYPKEIGLHELPDGQKIITVRRPKKRGQSSPNELQKPLLDNADTDIEPEPDGSEEEHDEEDDNDNDDDEKAMETELVHVPLHNVARQIWENVPGSDWIDESSGDLYKNTFTGKDATNYMLDAGFAPDGEDAVDYLATIMDEFSAFMRVDIGKEQEFENEENAHYQWIVIPDDEDDDYNENDQVALEDIMIGFRHSYGGYHRLLKQYRQAGIDPAQEAAKQNAAKHAVTSTPLSEMSTPIDNNNKDKDKSSSPNNNSNNEHANNSSADLKTVAAEGIKHLRSKSQKLLEDVGMLKKADSKDKKEQKHNVIINSPMSRDDTMADSDDDGQVVNGLNNDNNNHPQPPSIDPKQIVYSSSTTNFNKHKQGSMELANMPTTAMMKAQSHGVNEINRAKTMKMMQPANREPKYNMYAINETDTNMNNNQAEDTIVPLNKSAFPVPPALSKSKSVKGSMVKPGGLNRSMSSKNILLRHLDGRQKSAKNQSGKNQF